MRMMRGIATNAIGLAYTASGQDGLSKFCPTNHSGCCSNDFWDARKLLILLAVQVALLTIYDMCKAVDRGMTITDVRLLEKHGGKSGSYVAAWVRGCPNFLNGLDRRSNLGHCG